MFFLTLANWKKKPFALLLLCLLVFSFLGLVNPIWGDTIRLKNGKVYRGLIQSTTERGFVIRLRNGKTITIHGDKVLSLSIDSRKRKLSFWEKTGLFFNNSLKALVSFWENDVDLYTRLGSGLVLGNFDRNLHAADKALLQPSKLDNLDEGIFAGLSVEYAVGVKILPLSSKTSFEIGQRHLRNVIGIQPSHSSFSAPPLEVNYYFIGFSYFPTDISWLWDDSFASLRWHFQKGSKSYYNDKIDIRIGGGIPLELNVIKEFSYSLDSGFSLRVGKKLNGLVQSIPILIFKWRFFIAMTFFLLIRTRFWLKKWIQVG